MLTFQLNLSLTMPDLPFAARIDRAARLGFHYVECFWPPEDTLAQLPRQLRDAGLQLGLCNFYGGDLAAGERGVLHDPVRAAAFFDRLPQAFELAAATGCRMFNALPGRRNALVPADVETAILVEQLQRTCGLAAEADCQVLLEAINEKDIPGYLTPTTARALAVIDAVGLPNLRYQYDVYHMQRVEGDIVATITAQRDRIGHIQLADVPGRGYPGSGELHMPFILQQIAACGYDGRIGLEFVARRPLEEELRWLPADRRGPIALDALQWAAMSAADA